MKTINWTTATGTELAVTISTDFRLDRQGRRYTSGEKQVVIDATVNGQDHSHIGLQSVTNHPTCVAKLGSIGITAENLAKINDAIAAAKAEIAPHNAALDAHSARLDKLGNGDINTMFGADA